MSVLLVDDEVDVLDELASSLGRRGLEVVSSASADAALAVLAGRADIGALVSDIRMPGLDGLALAELALRDRSEAEALEVVLVTGYASTAQGMAASRLGAFGLLQKPMRGSDLASMVQDALARAARRRSAGLPGQAAATLPLGWSRRPTAEMGLPSIPAAPPRFARAPGRVPGRVPDGALGGHDTAYSRDPATPAGLQSQPARETANEAPLNPARAAEALLRALAQRLDAAGNGLDSIARDLRGPLGGLLRAAPQVHQIAGEPRRLLGLLDDLMDIAALEARTTQPQLAPISPHGLLDAVAMRLDALGLRCARRLILQPDADLAFRLDSPRLVRAMALLAGLTLGPRPSGAGADLATGRADLAIDAGAGQARLDLVIHPAQPFRPRTEAEETERRLPIAIARRLAALQGGRLDAWPLPEGGLRARLLIRGG